MTTWFDVQMAAQFARLYRTMAQARRTSGDMKLCRMHEATARKYEAALRDFATEIELDPNNLSSINRGCAVLRAIS